MKYIIFTFVFFITVVLLGGASPVLATLEINITEGCQSFGTCGGPPPDPGSFFLNLYNIGIAAASVLAVVMIVWGGIEYISSAANPSLKESGKKRIWAAIGGLLLALLSYVILQTINPALVGKGEGGAPEGSVQLGEIRELNSS